MVGGGGMTNGGIGEAGVAGESIVTSSIMNGGGSGGGGGGGGSSSEI